MLITPPGRGREKHGKFIFAYHIEKHEKHENAPAARGSQTHNRALGFMSDWDLFRADWLHLWRRRSGLRQDRDVDKMPKEMLI